MRRRGSGCSPNRTQNSTFDFGCQFLRISRNPQIWSQGPRAQALQRSLRLGIPHHFGRKGRLPSSYPSAPPTISDHLLLRTRTRGYRRSQPCRILPQYGQSTARPRVGPTGSTLSSGARCGRSRQSSRRPASVHSKPRRGRSTSLANAPTTSTASPSSPLGRCLPSSSRSSTSIRRTVVPLVPHPRGRHLMATMHTRPPWHSRPTMPCLVRSQQQVICHHSHRLQCLQELQARSLPIRCPGPRAPTHLSLARRRLLLIQRDQLEARIWLSPCRVR